MPKDWNQCAEPDCYAYVPCRRHPDAGIVGPLPPEELEDLGNPPWLRTRQQLVQENHRLRALYRDLRQMTSVWMENDGVHDSCEYARRVAVILAVAEN